MAAKIIKMALDISGIYFFMPVFSFLFVTIVVYAILVKTQVLGESQFINLLVSFIMAVIFLSFSSMELYLITILPWFVVLLVLVFLVLLVFGFSRGDLKEIMTNKFAWVIVAILVIIFLVAAVRVFNPVFDKDLIITSGGDGGGGVGSILDVIFYSRWSGSVLLLVIAAIVAWFITRVSK